MTILSDGLYQSKSRSVGFAHKSNLVQAID
jgi:hypothetical protein